MTHGGSLVSPPAAPSWELLGSSTDEFQAVGEDLTGSASNAEADIGYQVRFALLAINVWAVFWTLHVSGTLYV